MRFSQQASKSVAVKAVALLGVLTAGFAVVTSTALPSSAAPEKTAEEVVATPAGELVQHQRGIVLDPGNFGPTSFPFYDVPDGKRLVVEMVTGHLVMSNGAEMYVRVGPAGIGPHHVLGFPGGLDVNSEDNFIQRASTTQEMTFFVDAIPGSTNEFDVEIMRLNDTSDSALAQTITMVGRLYDL